MGQMAEQAIAERSTGDGVYNEVVIDTKSYVAGLPWSVEAFVFPVNAKESKVRFSSITPNSRTRTATLVRTPTPIGTPTIIQAQP
jgi:hypothetical protein